jgi:nucleotide-binding universal stress UspA family protein
VVAGIDGSEAALQAASLGARLAELGGGTLELVCVVELGRDLAAAHLPFGEEFLARHRRRCEEHVLAARHLLPAAPLSGARIGFGPAVGELLAVLHETGADLLCVGAGQHALPLGSVSAALVRRAPVPVLVARGGPRGRLARILVGYDGSEPAARAVTAAATLAREANAGVWVVHVSPPGRAGEAVIELARARELVATAGARLEDLRDETGDPAERLLAVADAVDADLLVVGARGRSGISRWLLGGTSDKLVAHATRAALVIR